jgi:hypothetical protein
MKVMLLPIAMVPSASSTDVLSLQHTNPWPAGVD